MKLSIILLFVSFAVLINGSEAGTSTDFVWSIPQPDLHVCQYMKQESSSKIASFDLDDTLVATKSGSSFPKDPTDFKLLDDKLPSLLKAYIKSGHRFVIFTNQAGVYYKKITVEQVKERIENVLNKMDPDSALPCLVLVATGNDNNRKPRTGMWQVLELLYNADIPIDRGQSFFVGDAAGRAHDHSASDLNFARNLNLTFVTPEQFLSATPDDIINIGKKNIDTMGTNAYGLGRIIVNVARKIGGSGKPRLHFTNHANRKAAENTARNAGKGNPPVHHTPHKPGQKPHYHPADRNGNIVKDGSHHQYPNKQG